MQLVFLNQYYPPDAAPTGVMLEAVVNELAAQGHEVTVICAEGGYAGERRKKKEKEKAILNPQSPISDLPSSILRIRALRFGRGTFLGKLADYLSYYLGVAWRLMWLRPRPDRIVALTTPPYLSLLARVFSKMRGGDHAHWVMDLYPDVMVAHGMLRDGGLAHRVLAELARWGFGGRRSAAVLSLGPDMAERIYRLTAEMDATARDDGASAWVPLWGGGVDSGEVDGTAVANRRHEMGWADHELVVMYSGNMGLGHRFGEILEVSCQGSEGRGQRAVGSGQGSEVSGQRSGTGGEASISRSTINNQLSTINNPFSPHPPRFVFFGGGKRRGEIEAFVAAHPEAAIELHDYAPADVLPVHLRSADVHLASLAPEWTGTMVPSKLQGIFGVGRPVIFIGSAESSIGRWVVESGGGWVVEPGDVEGLRAALAEAAVADERARRGARAAAFAKSHFDRQANPAEVANRLTSR